MARSGKADLIVVSSKGQVVIPQNLRKQLGIEPKSKLLVYGYEDALIMKKLEIRNVEKKLESLYRRIDRRIAKYGELSQKEIEEEVQKYRREKRRR